ncbi:bacillithiol biosynthesis cysteine-adding enzyme BshC [Brevibacillus fulvus]|uniref:Putative cysteine ligase BshC n=1 Tax=Brevibacillus fulvus TaxID=1125967 RepID=A0A939BRB9_9BACL|nr:bacillithiol biosynthesis cysteine-adding enzyme BshC [Brevibacillus fulvus]MBM7589308.1 bacillithiol biosynthesis cysteine-adding enzyme BshC [Brevibacillus fulvus]
MNLHMITAPQANPLVKDYLAQKETALQFFVHNPFDREAYRERLAWLRQKTYIHRQRLAEGLYAYNQQLGNSQLALDNIMKLREDDTYVVIAGQQAGVLTGPLYTIYKAIHVVKAARKLSEELQVNVVPVFWIAGEDHDLDEINHVYLPVGEGTDVKKIKLDFGKRGRVSASKLPLDLAVCQAFVDEFLHDHTETTYTGQIRQMLQETAGESATVADWFARIMVKLFGKHGLVFVESSSAYVRELEQPVFKRFIQQNEQVSSRLANAAEQLAAANYPLQLQIEANQANLFLYFGDERFLLEREGERFVAKQRGVSFSRDELLALLENEPQRFSANVVSRPLMQEHLFPTLAFIGGPGEVSYWAFYKELFADFDCQLPVVVPRMSVTLLEAGIERTLSQFELRPEMAFAGFSEWKQTQFAKLQEPEVAERFAQTRQAVREVYLPLVEEVIKADRGLSQLAASNLDRVLAQVDFLQAQLERSQRMKHASLIKKIERLETSLVPNGAWQERVYSYFTFANQHGLDLLDRLVDEPLALDGRHTFVSI